MCASMLCRRICRMSSGSGRPRRARGCSIEYRIELYVCMGRRGQTFTKLFTESTIRDPRGVPRSAIAPLCFFVYGAPVFAGQLTYHS